MVVKILGWLDALDALEKAMGPAVARRASCEYSKQEARDSWLIADDEGRELARVENGGTLVSSGTHAAPVPGRVSAIRVVCPCGEPKVAIGDVMRARRYECDRCGRCVMF